MALARLAQQLGIVFELVDIWARARALALSPGKCVLRLAGDPHVAQVLRRFPRYAAANYQTHGKYLGVMVGPDVALYQWGGSLC